jgi:hypothetical protein
MSKPLAIAFAIFAATSWTSLVGSSALAQGGGVGTGPVGTICDKDIKTYCSDLKHGAGAVRSCLEENRAKVSQDCRTALDTTGGGRMAK